MNKREVHTLIIEPDPSWRELLQQSLHNAAGRVHYHIVFAASLAEAHSSLSRKTPHFIVVDLEQVDYADALAFLHQVRDTRATRDSVIVCIAASHAAQDKIAAFKSGADSYYVKPINLDTFPMSYPLLERLHR